MKFRTHVHWLLFLSLALSAAAMSRAPRKPAHRQASRPPVTKPDLRTLAADAREASGWPALRRYAVSATSSKEKALTYFVLGYREFQKDRFAEAEHDLEKSSSENSILSDFAEYYRAASLCDSGQAAQGARLAGNFSEHFPHSALGVQSVGLLARCQTEAGEAERGLQTLTAEPSLESQPALLLAKGHALLALSRNEEAVKAFEHVYFLFPTSSEATDAGQELDKLRTKLGQANFLEPAGDLLTSRAQTLLERGRHREAERAFESAIEAYPNSPEVPRWKVGRARALLGLRRSEEVLDLLQAPFATNSAVDAERLETLVEAYALRGNDESMRLIVQQMGAVYPKSEAYEAALARVANFYHRRMDSANAKPFDEILANSFASSPAAEEARWRLGWLAYLDHHEEEARVAFENYVSRNPTAPRVPDTLYWLGRMAESGGARAEAKVLYETLSMRYAHNYFGGEARERLRALPAGSSSEGEEITRSWARAKALPELIPNPPLPPPWLCSVPSSEPEKALDVVALFDSLSLSELAETYLNSVLARQPASPEIYMDLGRVESEQGEVARSILAIGKAFPHYEEYEYSRTPESLWQLLFPKPFWSVVRRESELKGIDPYLVMGLIRQESAFNPNARSSANARGLMQVLPSTASRRRSGRGAAAQRLASASYNVQFGSTYLEGLLRDYNGVEEYALAAYHAGKTNVDEWLAKKSFREPAEFMESIPIPATRIYVEHVVRDARVYRDLMAGDPAFRRCP